MTPEEAYAIVDEWKDDDKYWTQVEARTVARTLRQALAEAQEENQFLRSARPWFETARALKAERDAALRRVEALENPSEDRLEDIAELFDSLFLPAWRACCEKHGRDTVHPAFASWGPAFLCALAALDKKPA